MTLEIVGHRRRQRRSLDPGNLKRVLQDGLLVARNFRDRRAAEVEIDVGDES